MVSNLSLPTTPLSPSDPNYIWQPSPPPTSQVLGDVASKLRTVEAIQAVQPNWPPLGDGQECTDEQEPEECIDEQEPENAVIMIDFESENGTDGDKAQEHARSIKVEFEPSDIRFWFSQLEGEMTMSSVKSQWLKRTILQRNLPNKQKEDVKSLLTLTQTQAGTDIYLRLKQNLVRIYATKPQVSYKKALSRTMTGLPSQLGHQIVDDICKKATKLSGCCCEAAALAIWEMKLPVNIRQHISNREFTATTYKEVFEAADKVYLSGQNLTVAAVSVDADGANLNETLPAFTNQNQPQVAAVSGGTRQRGGGRGQNRGARGRGSNSNTRSGTGRGGSRSQNSRSGLTKSSQNPPDSVCDRHYVHGDLAWYCTKPLSCPWVSKVSAPTS